MGIKIDTGLKTFDVEFVDRGKTIQIKFNPNDMALPVRLNEMQSRVNERVKGIEDFKLNPDGTPELESFAKQVEELTKVIYEETDRVFGYPISEDLFQYCSPLATIGGELFYEQVIKSVGAEIMAENKKEQKKIEKHIGKYQK